MENLLIGAALCFSVLAVAISIWRVFVQEKSHERLARDYADALAKKGRENLFLTSKVMGLEQKLSRAQQQRDERGRFAKAA